MVVYFVNVQSNCASILIYFSDKTFLFFSVSLHNARLHIYSDRNGHIQTRRLQIAHICVWTVLRIWAKPLCSFFSLSNREIVLWSSWISYTTPCVLTSQCTEWVSALSCFSSPHTSIALVCRYKHEYSKSIIFYCLLASLLPSIPSECLLVITYAGRNK